MRMFADDEILINPIETCGDRTIIEVLFYKCTGVLTNVSHRLGLLQAIVHRPDELLSAVRNQDLLLVLRLNTFFAQ